MNEIADALRNVSEDGGGSISPVREQKKFSMDRIMEGTMKKIWIIVGGVFIVVVVFFTITQNAAKDAVPLSEIFPEEEVYPVEVEYEFVQEGTAQQAPMTEAVSVSQEAAATSVSAMAKINTKTAALSMVPQTLPSYTIQIASFKDQNKAEEALGAIRTKVSSAFIASRDLGEKGVWYRIYAGQFERRHEAEVALNDIKQAYNTSFIISPKKIK